MHLFSIAPSSSISFGIVSAVASPMPKQDAIAFLQSSLAWFKSHGMTVERVMTDNGSAHNIYDFAPPH